ncbi:sugar phosphate isomerase/epimerase family protein [Terriglobus sp. RCC_193]|uniref:sugar phosphate isomerase/epimerase family protein n=1 Tax=Terriglobus sp. RCC_193 TaxID=3239218 RepID=UPI003524E4D2
MNITRRDFGRLAAAGISAAALQPRSLFAQGKPNSKINGVQIGVISYSYRQMKPFDALSVLKYAVEDGINATELENVQELWAGMPSMPPRPLGPPPAPGTPRPQMSEAAKAAMAAHAEEVTKWRTTMDVNKYTELRKLYNNAGVNIYAFKITLTDRMPDAEFDYAFKAAKACGANHLTMEMPDNNPGLTARIGKFGEKYKMRMGYHAHTQAKPDTWDEALAQSPWNAINLDIGHYTAAGNHDQIAFIQKNHARITSMHLKDRQYPEKGGQNQPFGEGDTPIKEVLQLMKKEKYNFPATIELEYKLPDSSDAVKEVAKCLAYAKSCLA